MRTVNMHAAKTHLSRLVDEAAAGEEIVIAKAGRPVARLVPLETRAQPRRPGLLKGEIMDRRRLRCAVVRAEHGGLPRRAAVSDLAEIGS